MDFATVPSSNYTFEQICSCLKSSLLINSAMKSSMASVPVVPVPKGLSVNIALQLFHKMGVASIAVESHPVVKLEKILAVSEIKITPTKIETVLDRTPVSLGLTRGYFVEKRDGPEPYMASVADAMAYVYTSSTPGTTPVCESNFRAGNATAAIPVIKTSLPLNLDWKKSKAYENSIATYEKLALNKATVFTAQSALVTLLKEAAPRKDVETHVPAPDAYTGPVVMNGTQRLASVAKPFIPGVQHIKVLEDVYRYLSVHRIARGEDNKWISPLTAGYYYGSMTRAMDKLLYKTADILHVIRELNYSSVYFVELPSMAICQSLAANGIIVFTLTAGAVTAPFETSSDGTIKPGTYRLRRLDDIKFDYLTVPAQLSTTRPVYKTTGVCYPNEDAYLDYLNEVVNRCAGPVLATCFLTPKLLVLKEVTLIPSLHAHAGHVLALFKTTVKETTPREQLIDRICTSNIFKTWFPLSRMRYLEYDYLVNKFRNSALQNMVLSVHTARASVLSADFGPFDGEFAPEMAAVVGEQNFSCNSLWTMVAQGMQTPQAVIYHETVTPVLVAPSTMDPQHLARASAAPPPTPPPPATTFSLVTVDY